MKKRYNNIDLFRIICIFGVLWLHCAQNNTFHACLASLGRLSVSCFVMMSGAMVMSGEHQLSLKQWFIKTFNKLTFPWLAACMFYIIENVLLTIKHGEKYNISVDINSLINYGYPERGWHLWYMYAIISIYLLVPIFWYIKNRNKNLYYLLIIPFFLIDLFWNPTKWYLIFVTYLWRFLVGDFIWSNLTGLSKKTRYIIYICTCICVIERMYSGAMLNSGMDRFPAFEGVFPPITICLLMISFSNINLKPNVYCVSKYILTIYLIHIFVGDCLSGILIALGHDSYVCWWTIIRDSAVIFVFSYGIAYVLDGAISRLQKKRTIDVV